MGHEKTNAKGRLQAALGIAAAALALLAFAPAAQAAKEHVFDPVLSLEGDCHAEDGVADPSCAGEPLAYPIGHAPKPFNVPCGVATDPHGDIYVTEAANETAKGRIDVFDSKGNFLVEVPDEKEPCKIAVDSKGNFYVTNRKIFGEPPTQEVVRYAPSSYPPGTGTTYSVAAGIKFERIPGGNIEICHKKPKGVAVDPSNDHLYVDHECQIEEFGSAAEGNPLIKPSIGAGSSTYFSSLAVYGRNHDVYAAKFGTSDPPAKIFVFDGADSHTKCEFDGSETPSGSFNFGLGGAIAVDQSSGDFYVYDIEHQVVDRFEAQGEGCPKYAGQLPPPTLTAVFTGFEADVGIGIDSPCRSGVGLKESCEAGTYDSPNAGEVFTTAGTTASNSHLFAFAPKVGAPPEVRNQAVEGVGDTEAVLEAELNPRAFDTTYRFQYTTQADFEADEYANATSVPAPDADAGAGGAFVPVAEPITGLTPGTTYRFRLVASNCEAEGSDPEHCLTEGEGKAGEEGKDASFATYPAPPVSPPCANAALRTGASAALSDCRAYELVTPPDTNGNIPTMTMLGEGFGGIGFATTLSSPDGESVVFGTHSGSIPELGGGGRGDTYEALRDPLSGWQSHFTGITAAQSPRPEAGGISPDHGYSFWDAVGNRGSLANLLPSQVGGEAEYLRVPAGLEPSLNCAPEAEPEGRLEWIGCGSEGFEPKARGKWISPGGAHVIFETSNGNHGEVRQLEECAPPTGTGAVYDRIPGGPTRCISLLPGNVTPGSPATFRGASADGSAVAFTIAGDDKLYVRRDDAETLEVATANPTFGGLSANGEWAFYVAGGNIFACDLGEGGCAGEGSHEPVQIGSGAESTLVNVSRDGSHAYFVSKVDLTPGEENEWEEKAESGKENLYAWDGSAVSFIARLTEKDVSGEFIGASTVGGLGLWTSEALDPNPGTASGPANDPSRTTPDGSVIVFESHAKLTDYQSDEHREVYRYQSGAPVGQRLSCLSCNPTGAAAKSDARLESPPPGSTQSEPFPPVNAISQIDNVANDGKTVFFQSPERLAAADTDAKQDVYEWEAQGMGGCERESGCLSLISGPHSAEDDYLYATSADGKNVFFLSGDTLVPQDPDGTPSVYDARVDGGFPEPESPPAECLGEACQPAIGAPSDPTPATAGHEGEGNAQEGASKPRCAKGKRRIAAKGKSRCVKGQAKKNKKNHHRANANRRAAR
jgi:hypothetical protein